MRSSAVLVGVGLVAAGTGFASGWTLRGDRDPRPALPASASVPSAVPAPSVEPAMEPEIDQDASSEPPPPDVVRAPRRSERPGPPAAASAAPAEPPTENRPRETPEEAAKRQEAALAALGFGSSAARDLRQRFERHVLARRILREQAQDEAMSAGLELSRKLKREIGDDAYGQMLWSGGRPNRVVIDGIVPDSSASKLDLRQGDVVVRYDGERIFEVDELRPIVREPSTSARAELEILRDGQPLKLSVPRGVLGIYVESAFDPPRDTAVP